MRNLLLSAFLLLIQATICFGQATSASSVKDTSQHQVTLDTAITEHYAYLDSQRSALFSAGKDVVNDIEQGHSSGKNAYVFIVLMLMLGAITYLKTSFGNDMQELIQSVVNRNLSQQIFRSSSGEISFSSVLLNLNFIVVMSLYVRFILVKYFHVSSLENFSAILFLIFLFTFFYLGKMLMLKFIGAMFEVNYECNEYIFNFSTACKTLGLALLPALFIFYTAQEKFFNFIFFITIFICAAFLALFIWRGLSTGYKLLYRSVYHFFIYVCVVEISPIFLLFKLLTKTII